MKRVAAVAGLAVLLVGAPAASAAPLVRCPAGHVVRERVFKSYATDLVGQQVVRYYLRVSWCRRGGVVTRAVATAWGESVAGSWDFKGNLEGPVFSNPLPDRLVGIYARGRFAYIWPPWVGRVAGNAQVWLQVSLAGASYTCVSGHNRERWGQRFHGCVTAKGGVG